MEVGTKVKVHADGTSVFTVVSIEDGDALIESVEDVGAGKYPFHCKVERLVEVEP